MRAAGWCVWLALGIGACRSVPTSSIVDESNGVSFEVTLAVDDDGAGWVDEIDVRAEPGVDLVEFCVFDDIDGDRVPGPSDPTGYVFRCGPIRDELFVHRLKGHPLAFKVAPATLGRLVSRRGEASSEMTWLLASRISIRPVE